MAGLLRQLFGGDDVLVPRQRLPVEGWAHARGVARLSLVWPWYVVEDPQPLVDTHGRDVGVAPALEIRAPRTDRDVVLILWAESGGGGAVAGAEWAASVARLHGGRVERQSKIALNGAMGHYVRISAGPEVTWRVIVTRHESVMHLEASAPASDADAYWVQIETMLATWGWDE